MSDIQNLHSEFHILLLLLHFGIAYIETNSNVNDVLNREQINEFNYQNAGTVNDSQIVENFNLVSEGAWAEQIQLPDSNVNVLENLVPNYLSYRSIKNDSKRSVVDENVQPVTGNIEQDPEVENVEKRTPKEYKKRDKAKSLNNITGRSVYTTTRGGTLWEEWTPWSSCSVTCGKGRHIRWRHCRENCDEAETEMEEKACQMPACPQKLFGLINL